MATDAGVERLVLTHVPPWYEPQTAHAAASATFTGPITVARPLLTYVV